MVRQKCLFQYHTFLHHSQTSARNTSNGFSFSTIRFYIILKPFSRKPPGFHCFSTIRFYIILKPVVGLTPQCLVSVPYVFTSFSNNNVIFHSHFSVSVPYVFTSFSNTSNAIPPPEGFQYHTFLHHSQTVVINTRNYFSFSTIRFYIILKRVRAMDGTGQVSVPYVFTSFSNNSEIVDQNVVVSVPYVFTSFSNL